MNRWGVNTVGLNSSGPLEVTLFAGSLSPSASLARGGETKVSGLLSFSGEQSFQTSMIVLGTLAPSGVFGTMTNMGMARSLSMFGGQIFASTKTISGLLSPTGDMYRGFFESLSGFLSPQGDIILRPQVILSGFFSPIGAISQQINTLLSGLLSPSATLRRRRLSTTPWETLLLQLRRTIDDTAAEVHSDATLYKWLHHGELLLAIHRYLVEESVTLTLQPNTPIYQVHSLVPDFVYPLRLSLSGTALLRATLSSLVQLDKDWYATTGTPQRYYMIGTTLIGFHPVPASSMQVEMTYLKVPPERDATVYTRPQVPNEWDRAIVEYAAGIAMAVEGDIQRAVEHMESFIAAAGLSRDRRFLPGASIKSATEISDEPLSVPED